MVIRALIGVGLALCILSGCGGVPGGVLNQVLNGTLPDIDNDALYEIAPPPGVSFELDNTLGTRVRNTITFSEAERAVQVDVPDFVGSWVLAEIILEVTYEGGVTQTLSGEFSIRPFEFSAEIACPLSVEAWATVIANVPILGRQQVASFGPYRLSRTDVAGEIDCGVTVEMEVFVDDLTGQINAEVAVH